MFNEKENILIEQIICYDDGGILSSDYDYLFNDENFKILYEENNNIEKIYNNLCKDNNSLYENNINILNLETCNMYDNRIPNQLILSIHPEMIEMVNRLNNLYNINFHVRSIEENEIIVITDLARWKSTKRYIYQIFNLLSKKVELI